MNEHKEELIAKLLYDYKQELMSYDYDELKTHSDNVKAMQAEINAFNFEIKKDKKEPFYL